jgi:hypothetical protein
VSAWVVSGHSRHRSICPGHAPLFVQYTEVDGAESVHAQAVDFALEPNDEGRSFPRNQARTACRRTMAVSDRDGFRILVR